MYVYLVTNPKMFIVPLLAGPGKPANRRQPPAVIIANQVRFVEMLSLGDYLLETGTLKRLGRFVIELWCAKVFVRFIFYSGTKLSCWYTISNCL